jgi:glutamate racemase
MSLHSASLAPSGRIDAGLHAAKILVFDSGLGGLSVLAELRREIPAAEIAYVADDAAFPYGDWPEASLRDHIVDLVGQLIAEHRPDFVVIACNTASTLVLPLLRARHSIPFVGTVPAVKPAAAATRSGLISVIATPRAIASDYTRQLVEAHAGGVDVTLVAAPKLASVVEAWLAGEVVDDEVVRAEIAPCFVERDGKRTDVVVLGCTHYPLLLPVIERVAPWSVDWIDGARAIARRAAEFAQDGSNGTGVGTIRFTSGKHANERLKARLASFGLGAE